MTIKTLQRRLDRLETDRRGDRSVLLLWDDGDDPNIEHKAEKAQREGRRVIVLRWQGVTGERFDTSGNRS